jgi:chromosome segregation ATPase
MESDEIEKRLEWLDSERQKANLELKTLKDRITGLENIIDHQKQTISSLKNEVKTVSTTTSRVSQFDDVLEQVKTDVQKQILDFEKKSTLSIKNLEKQENEDQNSTNKRFNEIQSVVPLVAEIKKNLQNRIDEVSRLAQKIDTLENYFGNVNTAVNVMTQENKRVSDDVQMSNKRLADIQVETTTFRKRLDEERNRNDLNIEVIQKIESNLQSLLAQETERKQNQTAFLEKASLTQIERENTWKAWQDQVNEINSLGSDFAQKLASLEATHKAIKQSQAELDEVNLRFDRRINELTEMHRLNEERFRQEWLSFKSDDQKRWTNYQLTQEEQEQEDSRRMAKLIERVTAFEDTAQEVKESIMLINEETEKQLKSFYSVFHDLIESYEQTFDKK